MMRVKWNRWVFLINTYNSFFLFFAFTLLTQSACKFFFNDADLPTSIFKIKWVYSNLRKYCNWGIIQFQLIRVVFEPEGMWTSIKLIDTTSSLDFGLKVNFLFSTKLPLLDYLTSWIHPVICFFLFSEV